MALHEWDNCLLYLFFQFSFDHFFLSHRLKKNLKMFIIVHPSWFIRTLLGITRPFIRFQPPLYQLYHSDFTVNLPSFFTAHFTHFITWCSCFLQHQVQQQDQICEQPTGAGSDHSAGVCQHSSQHRQVNRAVSSIDILITVSEQHGSRLITLQLFSFEG